MDTPRKMFAVAMLGAAIAGAPITSFAATVELKAQMESGQEDIETTNEKNGHAPTDAAELVDRSLKQYEEGAGPYNGYATYQEYVDSIKQDQLTDAQKEAGYVLIDGIAYPPEEMRGDAGEVHPSGVTPNDDTGYLETKINVPAGYHGDVYLDVVNTNSYQEFVIKALEIQKYAITTVLPSGNYRLVQGGSMADSEGQYYMDVASFEIHPGTNTYETFELHSNRIIESETKEEKETAEPFEDGKLSEQMAKTQEGQLSKNKEEKEERERGEKKALAIRILLGICFVIIITGLPVFFAWRWWKKHFSDNEEI